MANVFNGLWQVSGPAGTDYADFFQLLANVASQGGDPTGYTVTYTDGSSIEYGGSGLSYDGGSGTLTGSIDSVTVRDSGGTIVATLTSTALNPFLITSGASIHGGSAFFDLLLSGDNLVVGSPGGSGGTPDLLDGRGGEDTFRPANGHTTLADAIGASTLDLSQLTGPTIVDLEAQTFTVGGATGSMTGVSRVIGSDQADTILGEIDGEFEISTGAGNDQIQAIGATLYGGQFRLDAGAGDDTVFINQFGYGSLDGGDGEDTLIGGGDLRFYNFRNFETLEGTTGAVRVRTEQLKQLDHLTESNPFTDTFTIELDNGGTVDFGRLVAPDATFSIIAKAFAAGTNLNGSARDDEFQDLSNGLVDGIPTPSRMSGNGGNDTLFNNSGIAVAVFNGNMADYTITPGVGLNPPWIVTDNRPGSPDGTDTLYYFDHTKPLLKFRDHTASIDEQIAYKADPTLLPAQIYNGKLELFGPDNFDYEAMFPPLAKALGATLEGGTRYTVDYQGGIRIVFEGTGLSTSGAFAPTAGSVDKITVFDTSIPGQTVLLARLSSEASGDHLFRVPFAADLLTGGSQMFHRLMSGNNLVIGSANDDLIPITIGFDQVAGGDGFDTLLFSARHDSITHTPDAGGNGGTYNFVDDWGGTLYDVTIEAACDTADRAAAGENIVNNPLPTIINLIIAHCGGDPHITTFDGLDYLFQALGEFVLTKSTVPGDNFEIQVRTVAFPVPGLASVVEQAATRVGSDVVSFDASRNNVVLVNGLLVDLLSGPVDLDGGVLTRVAAGTWTIDYDTGEKLSVYQIQTATSFLSLTLDPGDQRALGTLQGVWGNYDGDRSNDYQVADGSVLARPLSHATLYGMFADAWRISQAGSILDYDTGETTDTFTNRQTPVTLSLSDIPQEILARAEALVNAAGITNQGLRNSALYDYLVTGDTAFIDNFASLQEQGLSTAEISAESGSLVKAMLGVVATEAVVTEAASGATTVSFEIYRVGPAIDAITADWAILDPGAGYFDAADFVGGVLPSGQVSFALGETRKTITVSIADGAVVSASERLKIEIGTTSATPVFAPTAYAEVVNNAPASAAVAADAEFLKLAGLGTLSRVGNAWTLDLGTIVENTAIADIRLAVLNAAARGANELSGTFDVAGSSLIGIAGAATFFDVKAGGVKGGLVADVDSTKAGSFSTTLTLHAFEGNDTGFSGVLGDRTLKIQVNFSDVPDTIVGTGVGETLTGEEGVDFIFGRAGNDTLNGLGFNDQLHGEAGNDRLNGGNGVDQLNGGEGNDVLDGGAGADVLRGGIGNDTYVNPQLSGGVLDTIQEDPGGGSDLIESNTTVVLTALPEIERILLTGSSKIHGIGNAANNVITGNGGVNELRGEMGADTLNGGAGADILNGGKGNDVMDGGGGADKFFLETTNTGNDTINGFQTSVDRFDLDGGTFSNRTEAGGNTTLTHSGGTVLVTGVTGLSLAQWNGLIEPLSAGAAAEEHAAPVAIHALQPSMVLLWNLDFLAA